MGFLRKRLKRLVDEINKSIESYGLDWEDISLWLNQSSIAKNPHKCKKVDKKRLIKAAQTVIIEKKIPEDFVAFKCFAFKLTNILKIELPLELLDTKQTLFIKGLRFLFSVILFMFVSYIVIGGLITEQSTLLQEIDPIKSFACFVALILALAAFEGLQIGVTTLRLRDLDRLRRQYPRAYFFHRKFCKTQETNKFLAGRQLFVIIVVFFTAQLTSFPNMSTWPFTNTPFPQWMAPWFKNTFLRLGIPGALLVLWIGQLAPQFIANKNPLRFINLFGMDIIYKLALFVESAGLTKPGNWLTKRISEGDRIPPSMEERYEDDVKSIQGYGTVGLKKIWNVQSKGASLGYQNCVIFAKRGFRFLTDNSLIIKGGSIRPIFREALIPAPGTPSDRKIIPYRPIDESLGSGWKKFVRKFVHTRGNFFPGDVILINT
ncbi:MAG: hypothetical protein ACTSR2_07330, partial [Candidatus Hodarchaeales archaeon]